MNGTVDIDTARIARNWWAIALRGVAAMIFGILTFVWPVISLAVLILLFGWYALVDGVFSIIAAVRRHPGDEPRWALLLEGVVSIAAGVVTLIWPGLTALVLLYVIAAWAIVTGVLKVIAAIRLRKQIDREWWLAASGVLSIVFGGLLMAFPGAGALALVLWIGAWAVVLGALLVGLAFRLRSWRAKEGARMPRAA